MTGRTAQQMQDHGVKRLDDVINNSRGMHVIHDGSPAWRAPPSNHLMVHIDGYDYLITIEFQDPR